MTLVFPKYENKTDDELICPYCEWTFSDSWESCSEDSQDQIDCPKCEKKFWGYSSKSIDYHSRADCKLNNEEHSYDNVNNGWLKCKICGDLKQEKIE